MFNCSFISKDLHKIVSNLKENRDLVQYLKSKSGVDIESTPYYFDENKSGSDDDVKTELRVFFNKFSQKDTVNFEIEYKVQIIVHRDIWNMDDGTVRPLYIINSIFDTLRNIQVGMGQQLKISMNGEIQNWGEHYSGYELICSTTKKQK